ncbi:MAG TPA: biopolymer transporter ExbD [Candidatus Omnitrophota bacterium]|nr:biopolymer transporter ExbD [Candidatus Omnitrophota bacterium]
MKIPISFQRKRARIEIIPLIDIIFFLLATFMMVSLSMVRNQGIAINFPTAKTGTPQEKEIPITITITEEGDFYWNKTRVRWGELQNRLEQLKVSHPDAKLMINGDENVYFGRAVSLLDEIRLKGIHKVSIQTKGAQK